MAPLIGTKLEFDDRQREVLIDKLPDAANLALGGLLFGQYVTGRPFSMAVALVGVVVWAGRREQRPPR